MSSDGGPTLIYPIRFGKPPNTGFYSKSDTLGTADYDVSSAAQYQWAHHYHQIVVARTDEILNSGSNQVVNLVTTKLNAAEEDIKESINSALLDPAASVAAKMPNSLGHSVNDICRAPALCRYRCLRRITGIRAFSAHS